MKLWRALTAGRNFITLPATAAVILWLKYLWMHLGSMPGISSKPSPFTKHHYGHGSCMRDVQNRAGLKLLLPSEHDHHLRPGPSHLPYQNDDRGILAQNQFFQSVRATSHSPEILLKDLFLPVADESLPSRSCSMSWEPLELGRNKGTNPWGGEPAWLPVFLCDSLMVAMFTFVIATHSHGPMALHHHHHHHQAYQTRCQTKLLGFPFGLTMFETLLVCLFHWGQPSVVGWSTRIRRTTKLSKPSTVWY